MAPYLKFTPYVDIPYDTEYIVALSADDVTYGEIPSSISLIWDICSVSKNANDSLSGATFTSYGKTLDYNLYTVPITHAAGQVISTSISLSCPNIQALSSYCETKLDFVSAGSLVLSVTGDYTSDTVCNLQSVVGYPILTNGTIDRQSGAVSITPTISLSSSVLSASYVGGYGEYTPPIQVNAFSQNILGVNINDMTYMYRISGVLDSGSIRNPTPNLSALEYFPSYPNNISLRVNDWDNLPEIRVLDLELVNYFGVDDAPFSPWLSGKWELVAPSAVSASNISTSDCYGTYRFTTPTFNSTTDTPNDYTVSVYVTGYDIDNQQVLYTGSKTITMDEFPDEESFNFGSFVSNNNPISVGLQLDDGTFSHKLWRLNTEIMVSATPQIFVNGLDPSQGKFGVTWGDGSVSAYPNLDWTIAHQYDGSLGTFRINTYAQAVSAENWLSAHSKTDISGFMDVEFVDRFLSGTFIAYPQYYFDSLGVYHALNSTNYTDSVGVCAYGEGSNVIINLSAAESDAGTLYQWGIDYREGVGQRSVYTDIISASDGLREDTYDFGDSYSYTSAGSALSLSVFNSTFPANMSPFYVNDLGNIAIYPNFDIWPYAHTDSSDNSNTLFQNVRVFRYESPTYALCAITQSTDTDGITIATELDITFPSYSPTEVIEEEYVWTISATNWSDVIETTSTSKEFSYTLLEGNGIVPGTIERGKSTNISIEVSPDLSIGIDTLDFDARSVTTSVGPVTASVLGTFESVLRIFTNDLHTITGDTIYFQNITDTSSTGTTISAYIWNVGDGSGYFTVSGSDTNPISASYNNVGTYSVSLTSITTDGVITTRTFSDIITVESHYPEYDSDIIRIYGSTDIKYPYELVDIIIKPNEWVTADNINSVFDKFDSDIEYLKNVCKKYREPPTKLYGWLGQSKYNETDINWHVTIPGINGQYSSPENATTNSRGLDDIRDISIYNDDMYIVNKTELYVLSSDYNATEISSRAIKTIGDPFFDINAIEINSNGLVYVLDSAVQRITVFNTFNGEEWEYLYGWGKYGGPDTFKGFKNPVDLHVDRSNNVWVTDNGNNVIKKYTKTGSWLKTIKHSKIISPISMTTDVYGNIHVLTSDYVVKFNSSGTYVKTYDVVSNNQTPKRIITGRDGFLYIVCDTGIIKVTPDGEYGGIFANTLGSINFNSAYQDQDRNLYVTNYNNIIKYYDKIKIDSISEDLGIDSWNMSDIYINKNEYVQDWVYNKSFSRLWDNIEIVRRSINGVIYEVLDAQKNTKNIIVGFTPYQYNLLYDTVAKTNIFIGINEIVSADSINRCIKMLYDILDLLLKIVSGQIGSYSEGEDEEDIDVIAPPTEDGTKDIGWRWTDVASWGMNPFTWEQVSTRGFYPTRWECAITDVECDN